MIKQRWTEQPPAELRGDRVLLYRVGTKLDNWQHGFQYLDKFDVVLVREGKHGDEVLAYWPHWERCIPTPRVPIFRYDMLWLRRSEATTWMLNVWQFADDYALGLQIALYFAQPLIWMLPDWQQWQEEHEAYKGYDLYACRDENDWRATVWQNGAQLWMGPQNTSTEAAIALAEAKAWVDEGGARNGAVG